MMIIGLTGGIGSGKTTVSKFFSDLGVAVYNSDFNAQNIINRDEALIELLKLNFGKEIYKNQEIDRRQLSNIVFNDTEKLSLLNKLVHPRVKKHFEQWVSKQDGKYVIKEAAILFESRSYLDCHKIITVVAPLKLRIASIILRDNITKSDVVKRIKSQWSDKEKIEKSDFVINNDFKTLESLKQPVHDIHQKINALSS